MDNLLCDAIANLQTCFSGPENTQELLSRVKTIIPIEESQYQIISVQGNTGRFKTTIKTTFHSEEDIAMFIQNYGIKNNETLRVTKARKASGNGKYTLIKYFRCHHHTRYEATRCPAQILASQPSKRFKNTNCPYSLVVRLGKRVDEDYNSSINLEWNHNHSVDSLHSLSFKDIPSSVTNTITQMYASGLLPGAAHREFLRQLRSECEDDLQYHRRLSDRSEAPRREDFNRIYSDFKEERFGTGSMSDMFSALEERIKDLKEKDAEYTIEYQKFDETINQPFIMVVVTPLMKRVHKLVAQAKDLAFLDSSSNMEEYNLRVFVVVTHSVCGALPLGIFVTSDEKEQTLTDALELFKSSLPDFAFYGAMGPRVFMTDNCHELRVALKDVWPKSVPVLCIFHVLQQVWRWLHEKKNRISLEDRPPLLLAFKNILYAENEDDLQNCFDALIESDMASKYPNFEKYITDVFEDCESWALCYRIQLPMRGNNTNNLCEAQFLVIKDEILNRQKEVNVVGLMDKFTTELDQHYRNKLLSVSSGKFDGIYSRRFKGLGKKKSDGVGFKVPSFDEQKAALGKIVNVGCNMFMVPSLSEKGVQYLVDMNTGFCQCKIGVNGSPCKHQYILWANKLSVAVNFLPVFSKEQRMMYAEIAIGATFPLHFYEGLHDQVISLPATDAPCCPDPSDSTCIGNEASKAVPLGRRNMMQDCVAVEECHAALEEAMVSLQGKLASNATDQNFLRGVLKFADRVKKMPKSKLTTSFHCFGAEGVYNTRLTTTSIVKKRKRGKIAVQPEAVKRRKVKNGSRQKQNKGQTAKNNPFQSVPGNTKRAHRFAENVQRNEPVAKKAGRSMATKTRIYEY